jgi:hypothetical protein
LKNSWRAERAARPVSESRWSAASRLECLAGKRRSGTTAGNGGCARDGSKALKGKAQERGELKEASLGRGADTAERVAKP